MGGLFGGGTSTNTVSGRPLTSAEKSLITEQRDLARLAELLIRESRTDINRFDNIANQNEFRQAVSAFNQLERVAGRDAASDRQLSRQITRSIVRTSQNLGTEGGQAIRRLVRDIERDPLDLEATRQDVNLINEIAQQQIALGSSDIQANLEDALDQVRGVLAPSRGLRPGDSPVFEAGGRVVNEALRQQGQLVRGVRGTATQAIANRPFQRAAIQLQERGLNFNIAASAFGAGQQGAQFQAGIAQQSQANRAQFASALAELPLNLTQLRAGIGTGVQPQIGSALSAIAASQGRTQSSAQTVGPLQGAATIAGGAGALLAGIGLICDRDRKDEIDQVNMHHMLGILEKTKQLGLVHFRYRAEGDKAPTHLGPYAQDFREAFGYGASQREIHLVDAIGVLFAAVKALAHKVGTLEMSHAST